MKLKRLSLVVAVWLGAITLLSASTLEDSRIDSDESLLAGLIEKNH